MPLFQYRAQDNEGRTVEGMVTADTAAAATQSLTERGFRIFDLAQKGGGAATAPQPAPRPPAPGPTVQPQAPPSFARQIADPTAQSFHTPLRRTGGRSEQILLDAPTAARPTAVPAGPQRVNAPAAAPVQIVRTKRGTDKANTFLFSQLASFFRAGINPAEAFTRLSSTHPKPWYRQSLVEAAKSTAEGLRFSQVLERYPDLYPPHIPGMIRAGEEGGFLVEATEAVAEQTNESLKFNRWPILLFWWIFSNIIFLPPCLAMSNALEKVTNYYFRDGGADQNGGRVMMQAIFQNLLWPVGPMTILITAACWIGYWWWMQLPQRMLRHRALLKVPTIGKRARSESLATFAWVLSMVSRAGIAPRTAWNVAAGAMPNLALGERMRQVGAQMHDGTKLSEAIHNSKVVPEEYGPIVSNGELVGDVSSALMTISTASRDDFARADGMSKMRFGCWGALVIAFVFLASGMMVARFYNVMIPAVSSSD